MKTDVQETSIDAHAGLTRKGTQKAMILEYVMDQGEATRGMIAHALKMEKSTVSARVNELLNGEFKDDFVASLPKLENSHKDICPISHVRCWYVKPIGYEQTGIFD